MRFSFNDRYGKPRDARRQAIAETNAFLSWALSTDQQMPRIPRRRVDRGGFGEMMKKPFAANIITYWWAQALDRIRDC